METSESYEALTRLMWPDVSFIFTLVRAGSSPMRSSLPPMSQPIMRGCSSRSLIVHRWKMSTDYPHASRLHSRRTDPSRNALSRSETVNLRQSG